jgi:hypothetical protein
MFQSSARAKSSWYITEKENVLQGRADPDIHEMFTSKPPTPNASKDSAKVEKKKRP